MYRADHHGINVNEIVLTLAGAVIWRASQDVVVRTYNDETANILWLIINKNRYALTYNHDLEQIELHTWTQGGSVLARFDNNTTSAEVKEIFKNL
jgi:hypothetical protein